MLKTLIKEIKMTINQLLKETYALGFEDTGEADGGFFFSAARAQRQIFSELAGEVRRSIVISAPSVTYHNEEYLHAPDERREFRFKGFSFSFKFSGRGNMIIEDKSSRRSVGFRGESGVVREIFDRECSVTFYGEFSFLIKDLAAFGSNHGYNEADVPVISEYTEHKLTSVLLDYSRPAKPVTDKNGKPIEGAHTVGDSLYLPFGYSGEVLVTYKPQPKPISTSDLSEEIDIPPSLEHLLPILTASYLWLDDDPEKAEYYAAIYRSEAARLTVTSRHSVSGEFSDVTGWA